MSVSIFSFYTLCSIALLKFIYGKKIRKKNKFIIRSYIRFYDVYSFENTYDEKLKIFYKVSNVCNLIIWVSVIILIVNFVFSLSVF